MASALKLTGMESLIGRLHKARKTSKECMRAAMVESLAYLEECAQQILDAEVYDKQRAPFASELTFELYRSFVSTLASTGVNSIRGKLTNFSEHAGFLEWGTDDEGTGEHMVPVSVAGALHWVNPQTGASMFSKGHMVKGIKPIHFMQRALVENEAGVIAIFERHFSHLFD